MNVESPCLIPFLLNTYNISGFESNKISVSLIRSSFYCLGIGLHEFSMLLINPSLFCRGR
ncbi:unnamed protein product [Moneuplotes crassus]|uniref:Uncharacterized protein n=1 Tax=Euplotes crassus TaxID=5936 RepID=A0AAD1X928_EUPCR|nr:unnamed protein product [Moneuplotes crassus]